MRPSLQIFDKSLFKNSRFYILLTGLVVSWVIWFVMFNDTSNARLSLMRLEQVYGFMSLGLVYIAVLASPLTGAFPSWKINPSYLHARRAFGVLGFYFGVLHTSVAFFGQLGGFDGLGFLTDRYLISLGLGVTGLFILLLMAVTSFDYAIWRMSFPKWKFLHRFVYLAIITIIIHIILISSHVRGFLAPATQAFILLGVLLGSLEAIRLDRKHPNESLAIGRVGAYTWGFMLVATLFLLAIVTANDQPANYVPPAEVSHGEHAE